MKTNRTRFVVAAVALAVTALCVTGCAKEDRMDTAIDKGVEAGKKAAAMKQGTQQRVDNATAILDGK